MNRHTSLRQDLARAIRRLYDRGLVSGVGGNASVLLPSGDELLITPTGYFKGGVAEGDLVRVTLAGRVIGRGQPSSELATHLITYTARGDIRAVVHAHPPVAVALATAGIDIPLLTPEQAALIPSLEVVKFVPPGERGAMAVRDAVGRSDLVGIRNHGFFSLGADLHEAVSRLEVLEESSMIFFVASQFGKVPALRGTDVEAIRETYASRRKVTPASKRKR